MTRHFSLLLLALFLLSSLGCGPKRPLAAPPQFGGRSVTAALNPSPIAGESVVVLPLEVAEGAEASAAVLLALAEQHRATLVEGRFVAHAYASLTEAEAAEPGRTFLMLRGTVQEYVPTVQERWGKAVRTSLALKIKYDVWNPADGSATLTLRAKNVEAMSTVDSDTPDGRASESQAAADLARLTEAAFVEFNNTLIGNQQIVRLARRGKAGS